MNRRMFLRGLGGSALSIPLLPSLLPTAQASTATTSCPRFVAMATQHGGIWGEHMWPDDTHLTETDDVGHTVRRGALSPTVGNGTASLSQVLSASTTSLTPSIVDELNLLRGLDIPFYIAHHTGGYLGNYGRNDGEGDTPTPMPYVPTIDQLMAWSSGFYSDLSGVARRSVHLGGDMSWGWSNPVQGTGTVDRVPPTWSSLALFDSLFDTSSPTGQPRRLTVDKVLASYSRLRDGAFGPGRRLSAGDRDRLDAHMQRLFEVERRLLALGACGPQPRPTQGTEGHPGELFDSLNLVDTFAYHQLWNEVLALALTCGSTRVATYNCLHTFEPYVGDWHQDVAHEAYIDLDAEQQLARGQQRFFEGVFLDLCNRLDVPDADGNTVLHNSAVLWVQESGAVTHDAISLPVVMAGSAGGALQTGQYVDYRHRTSTALGQGETVPSLAAQRPGLLYAQFLGHLLDVMGVARSSWEVPGNPGYGIHRNDLAAAWPAYVEALGDEPLPWLG